MKAASELDLLIAEYKSCEFSLFREFARLLQKHRSAIIRSFSIVDTKVGKVRPSNGPTESLNRRPKDMKRNARGYSNFEHVRNRILFALPMEAPILPQPREKKEFRKDTGKVRGPYKKKKRDILTYSVRYPAFFIACSTRFAAGPAAEAP